MFFSFQQGVNNYATFTHFLISLTTALDKSARDWRSTHVFLLDNSPVHTCGATSRVIEALKIPTIFTGPASYACLPVERIFAAVKQKFAQPERKTDELIAEAALQGFPLSI
jgi:hypothetical protein